VAGASATYRAARIFASNALRLALTVPRAAVAAERGKRGIRRGGSGACAAVRKAGQTLFPWPCSRAFPGGMNPSMGGEAPPLPYGWLGHSLTHLALLQSLTTFCQTFGSLFFAPPFPPPLCQGGRVPPFCLSPRC